MSLHFLFWLLCSLILINLALCAINLRSLWVSREQWAWMTYDFPTFKDGCPSYTSMMMRFWIWDIRKFGRKL